MGGEEDRLERALRERGAQAGAEILAAQKTTNVVMEGGDTWFVWRLKLRVRPCAAPSFEADVRHRYVAGETPAVGSKLTVLYDPSDHAAVCVARNGPSDQAAVSVDGMRPTSAGAPTEAKQAVRRLAADLGAIEERRRSTARLEHLTRAADLHEQGVLTDAEFEKLKQRILAD
jgi:hypothetical protein